MKKVFSKKDFLFRLSTIIMIVADLRKSLYFFCNLLGFPLIRLEMDSIGFVSAFVSLVPDQNENSPEYKGIQLCLKQIQPMHLESNIQFGFRREKGSFETVVRDLEIRGVLSEQKHSYINEGFFYNSLNKINCFVENIPLEECDDKRKQQLFNNADNPQLPFFAYYEDPEPGLVKCELAQIEIAVSDVAQEISANESGLNLELLNAIKINEDVAEAKLLLDTSSSVSLHLQHNANADELSLNKQIKFFAKSKEKFNSSVFHYAQTGKLNILKIGDRLSFNQFDIDDPDGFTWTISNKC